MPPPLPQRWDAPVPEPPIRRVRTPEYVETSLPDHAVTKTYAVGGEAEKVAMYGYSAANVGVYGSSGSDIGVYGTSDQGSGVHGEVGGNGVGVVGTSVSGSGVYGEVSGNGVGVVGRSVSGVGVSAESRSSEAIHAATRSPTAAAIAAYNTNGDGTGAAIYGKKIGKGHAGFFDGEVFVTGHIGSSGNVNLLEGSLTVQKGDVILQGADCAEEFEVASTSPSEPGTVMVLSEENRVSESVQAYDTRVAGVISGAGAYKPGIILDRQTSGANRHPVALLGKVYCKVDAAYGAIAPGDLLTTSPTPGHAMKVSDPIRAYGAMLGKALASLAEGCGLIPVLVTLR